MRRLLPLLLIAATAALAASAAQAQTPYSIPADNPFAGKPGARGEVFVYGLRNPFRWSFDRATGDMAIGDVGGGEWEEVDFLRAGSAAGTNLGWNCREGNADGPGSCSGAGSVGPLFQYSRVGDSSVAVTGGYVVRDPAMPSFVGRYLFGDYFEATFGNQLRALSLTPGATPVNAGETVPSLVGFGENSAGNLYAASVTGPVYRLTESAGQIDKTSIGTFDQPMAVAGVPGQPSQLFVVERGGTLELRTGTTVHQFLDISADVALESERGFLSAAVAPDYASSGRIFVYYTDKGGDLRLDEVRRSASDPLRADPSTRRNVLTIEHSSQSNHNGGTLQFGPDRRLYLSTGDGGGQGDPAGNAQNLGVLLGKIIRIDVGIAPAGDTPGGGAGDMRKPVLRATVRSRQRVLRLHGAVLHAGCDERCRVAVGGRLRIGKRAYGLRRVTRSAAKGKRVRIKARLTRRGTRALRKALADGRHPKVRIGIRARDAAGNASPLVRRTVRVKR
jgi:Glucose / Sorbosone dehydrogenase